MFIIYVRWASSSDTTEDELLKVLENCIGNDPTYTVSLIINEDDELELLYIQTSRMKGNGQELSWGAPHGLHVSLQQQKDATQYYDGHGWKWCLTKKKKKKSWAYALLRNERQETLRLFLSKFKELNSSTT